MLTIEDLHREDILKEFEIRKSYEKVLECCQGDIQHTHRYMRKDKMLFTIPRGYMEEPEYDFIACTIFLIKNLRDSGFEVRFVRPNFIYIAWINPRKIERKLNDLKTLIKEDYQTHKAFGLLSQRNNNISKRITYKKLSKK